MHQPYGSYRLPSIGTAKILKLQLLEVTRTGFEPQTYYHFIAIRLFFIFFSTQILLIMRMIIVALEAHLLLMVDGADLFILMICSSKCLSFHVEINENYRDITRTIDK